jgi:hypothetical protein
VQRLSVQALARELTVRKMERDVAELERLRRLDEDRIRLETERLKAVEAAKTAEPSNPGPGGSPLKPEAAADQPSPQSPLPATAAPAGAAATLPQDAASDSATEEAKRRAAELRAIEARKPQPAAKKTDPFRQGPSP